MPAEKLITDEDLQRDLVRMILWNKDWLQHCSDLVRSEEFKPLSGQTTVLWILAQLGLDFYRKHRVPIDSQLSVELRTWFKDSGTSTAKVEEWKKALAILKKGYDPARAKLLIDYVKEFKAKHRRDNALYQLIGLREQDQLTDEKWVEIMRNAMEQDGDIRVVDYASEFESRQERRMNTTYRRTPSFQIDPLDQMVRGITRGQLGLWLGYYKMGKSLALIHTAVSYAVQSLDVLYFSLEDTLEDVEDRFDSSITQLATADLGIEHEEAMGRFTRFQDIFNARVRLIDGTSGMTMSQIESVFERLKNSGFHADAVFIDYDDEVRPTTKRQERRMEFHDIYMDMRRFAAKHQVYLWTAGQANRAAEGKEVVGGQHSAEDISKIRKATMTIGIGQGSWGENSRTLYVAAHRNDQSHGLCTIWSAPDMGMFYDRDATLTELERKRMGTVR